MVIYIVTKFGADCLTNRQGKNYIPRCINAGA